MKEGNKVPKKAQAVDAGRHMDRKIEDSKMGWPFIFLSSIFLSALSP
jgi:hypothetical protein